MKGQVNLLLEIDNEIFTTLMTEVDICYGCKYGHTGCCDYDTKDDYCVLGNKKIPVQL